MPIPSDIQDIPEGVYPTPVVNANNAIIRPILTELLGMAGLSESAVNALIDTKIAAISNANVEVINLATAPDNLILSADQARKDWFLLSGTPTANKNITFPNTVPRIWQIRDVGIVRGAFTVTTTIAGGTPHVLVENAWLERIATGA